MPSANDICLLVCMLEELAIEIWIHGPETNMVEIMGWHFEDDQEKLKAYYRLKEMCPNALDVFTNHEELHVTDRCHPYRIIPGGGS